MIPSVYKFPSRLTPSSIPLELASLMKVILHFARPSSLLIIVLGLFNLSSGLGPAYGGDKFVRFKELPPSHVTARVSGSLSLTCSATGSPTPVSNNNQSEARI